MRFKISGQTEMKWLLSNSDKIPEFQSNLVFSSFDEPEMNFAKKTNDGDFQ